MKNKLTYTIIIVLFGILLFSIGFVLNKGEDKNKGEDNQLYINEYKERNTALVRSYINNGALIGVVYVEYSKVEKDVENSLNGLKLIGMEYSGLYFESKGEEFLDIRNGCFLFSDNKITILQSWIAKNQKGEHVLIFGGDGFVVFVFDVTGNNRNPPGTEIIIAVVNSYNHDDIIYYTKK